MARCSRSRTRSSSARTAWPGAWTPTARPSFCTRDDQALPTAADAEATCRAVRCPVLVLHGDRGRDRASPPAVATRPLDRRGAGDGGGRRATRRRCASRCSPTCSIATFAESACRGRGRAAAWTPARNRRRRALFVCSPIGLGHVRRDLAIADELRAAAPRPGDRLAHPAAGHPGARGARRAGAPGVALLASETAHLESEAGEHDLHVFRAVRRMDEILVANFMVFADLVERRALRPVGRRRGLGRRRTSCTTTPSSSARRSPGSPTSSAGCRCRTAATTRPRSPPTGTPSGSSAVAGYPRLRDRSVFVGEPADVVDAPLGPGLPTAREWARERYAFAGYVAGCDAAGRPGRGCARRSATGPTSGSAWSPSAGPGSGGTCCAGSAEAFRLAEKQVPGLRMVWSPGRGSTRRRCPCPTGVEVHGYLPDLHRHLAACDLAVVQGGLTTTMELVAARRPFLYVPLAHHFEQQVHVPHRLARYGAGRRLDYADAPIPSGSPR